MQHVHLKGSIIQCDHCGNRTPLPSLISKELMVWLSTYEAKHTDCEPAKFFTVTRFNVEPLIAAAFEAYAHKKRTGLPEVWIRYLDTTFGPLPPEIK